MLSWIAGHDQAVAEWARGAFLAENMDLNFYAAHSAFGVATPEGLQGAVVFSDYYPGGNVEITYVGRGTLTRAICREIAYHAFITLAASRVTAKTQRRNATVARLLTKAGFQFECIQKRYYGPTKGDDAIVYGLPIEKGVRWLKGVSNG